MLLFTMKVAKGQGYSRKLYMAAQLKQMKVTAVRQTYHQGVRYRLRVHARIRCAAALPVHASEAEHAAPAYPLLPGHVSIVHPLQREGELQRELRRPAGNGWLGEATLAPGVLSVPAPSVQQRAPLAGSIPTNQRNTSLGLASPHSQPRLVRQPTLYGRSSCTASATSASPNQPSIFHTRSGSCRMFLGSCEEYRFG